MAGIRISFIEDVSSFLRGAQRSEDALDDVADSLDDLARDAQREGRDIGQGIERGVEQGTDGATDSVERLERSFREMARDVSRTTRDVGDDAGDNVRRGMDQADDAVGEFRDEARSNFSEVASSFTGDMTSAVDGVQGLLGGLAGSLAGPAGLAAGVLAGIGGAFFASWQENTEKTKQVVSDMYDDLVQSGEDYLSESYRQEEYWRILKNESDVVERARVDQIAAYSKTSSEEVALAYAGDAESMRRVTDGLIAKRKEFEAQLRDETTTNDSAAKAGKKYIDEMIAANERRTESIVKTTDEVIRARDYFTQMGTSAINSAEEARRRFSGVGEVIANMPKTASVKVTADTRDLDRELARPRTVRVNVAPAGGMRVV